MIMILFNRMKSDEIIEITGFVAMMMMVITGSYMLI